MLTPRCCFSSTNYRCIFFVLVILIVCFIFQNSLQLSIRVKQEFRRYGVGKEPSSVGNQQQPAEQKRNLQSYETTSKLAPWPNLISNGKNPRVASASFRRETKRNVSSIVTSPETPSSGSRTTTRAVISSTSPLNASIPGKVDVAPAPICPESPPGLVGIIPVDKSRQNITMVKAKYGWDVFPGGFYRPASCLARHRVAIVIPFRDRDEHLVIFLNHMMPFLKKQQLEFAIYIVELAPKEKFNRAMLMNVGYRESIRDRDWQCFVFHDVDLLPENDKNIYSCPTSPRHMSAAVDTMNYKLPYQTIFGGVSAFSRAHFELINGFSNMFFGWGGEDDDLYARTAKKGLKLTRYPMKIARYKMLKHAKDKPNPERYKFLNGGTRRMTKDGITNLKYKLIRTERHNLYTKLVVSIDEKAVRKSSGGK